MTDAHRRKKQPDLLRQQLLRAAAHLALEHGAQGVSMDGVAALAGVSKGGLQHHFRSKQALLDALFEQSQQHVQEVMAAEMAAEADAGASAYGRVTRAYLRATAHMADHDGQSSWRALTILMLADPALRARWSSAIQEALPEERADSEQERATLLLCRLAADGLWLNDVLGCHAIAAARRAELLRQLERMTHRKDAV
ncbi:AcrR family transcriptional regulator [Janthinobacterium sp. CG_23.3]|uniref:TetR/AcrR family transcriptional regulator n=1 Tax=unclassified Janthinobacterium TaxID=2610881 RepID=UPI00037D2802|nr:MULTISPECIES: TetR/AcrR family transcriptional regulator [unclassified Janthinobacterium]MEC5161144.1 AcrR family transcriptional regulator [Janthinobacterium sp. CG_S6]